MSRSLRSRLLVLLCSAVAFAGIPVSAQAAQATAIANAVVYQKNSEGYDCFRIPAVIKANNGDLLAFAEGRRGGAKFCADAGDIDLIYKRSTDGGKHWGPIQVVIKGFGDTKGNPTPILVPGTGRIVLLSTYQCVKAPACGRIPRVQHSDDNGKTWTTPREITRELGFPSAPGWLATGPSHGIVLTRGAHAGRLVAGMSFGQGEGAGSLIYSDDQGETWRRGATDVSTTPTLNPQEISVVELTDGRVYAAARNDANSTGDKCVHQGHDNRAFAISSDGGETFSRKFAFEPDLVTPPVQGSTVRLRATDQGSKYNRILFAGPSTCDRRKRLVVRSSFDEGGNWQNAEQGTLVWGEDAAYTDMAQLGPASAGILYESGPEYDANATIRWSVLTEAALGLPDGNTAGLPVTPDSSPSGNHAWLRGGATLAAGRFGQAVALDGKDDFVQLPFAETLATGAADFTWSGWFNYGAVKTGQALLWAYHQGEGFSQVWLRAEPGSKRIRAHVENGPTGAVTADSATALDDRAWHHFALRRSGGTVGLYLDGKLAGSGTGLSGSVSPGRPFTIHVGQRLDGQNRLQGSVDDYRLYARALSETEIATLAASADGPTAGLRLHLPFERASS
ncbi:sialidase family protein [Amycolatopsis anabasis]|uniref:sialidase family protein n=1 Tax=Amycolatopsis anabasis TaxID=1840409 RepID=UPI00131C0A4B|nr:sialidase family protein [Amycolatopsis anabasis]